MTCVHIICGDVRDMPVAGKFQAVLTDPPYELGFMGKSWDASGIAYDAAMWEGIMDLLHPGAWVMAFGGSRGWHRLAVAVEDAGFRIHPSIFVWATGQSFPKATRIDTQIDKAAGAEREVVATERHRDLTRNGRLGDMLVIGDPASIDVNYTAPATLLARAWAGHRYGGQTLKNAADPIIVAQVPYEGRPVDCIVETGAGALWIDGARVGMESTIRPLGSTAYQRRNTGILSERYGDRELASESGGSSSGRWPANLILCHTDQCRRVGEKRVKGGAIGSEQVRDNGHGWFEEQGRNYRQGYADADGLETVDDWLCSESCPVRKLGEQSGERPSGSGSTRVAGFQDTHVGGKAHNVIDCPGYSDHGTAARFFQQVGWELDHAEPVRYQAKSAKRERNAALERFVWKREGRGHRRIRSDAAIDEYYRWKSFGRPTKHFDEWLKVTGQEPRKRLPIPYVWGNIHSTVKPIALARHLATLLLPPPEYAPRRLLIPFGGVSSEALGAILAGWEEVVVIEQSEDYCQIAAARIKWWMARMQETGSVDVKVILAKPRKPAVSQPVML